ncbi:C2H2 type zinc-finger-domain-containing protein [Cokeromyces recurvatus]|uniref:C2H2 type zinc-finger-domain-containing protein n=1 Tax=Cokeromyces recurvatus TaxID=90255 RepID=UPI00221E95DE|nr:C2H2 type zinc-finger-domain-containing protein [Cokeromyces recurvatus]KAI7898748.1 C2H2 type zinc-finger-domain-containing protein [Cokeromyces recurvatus]
MSTILTEFNPSFKTHQSNPNNGNKTTMFTCLACQVAFPTSERQRNHYRTDWHKYNLKRKVANLLPVTAEQFNQKVLSQQAQNREELEKQGLVYECQLCKKSYFSENAFNNHIQSRKHIELQQKAINDEDTEMAFNKMDENPVTNEQRRRTTRVVNPLLDCLFCCEEYSDFDTNLSHMLKSHGFFLPDIEYLKDKEGLIQYLSNKINKDYLCLYCNGRGKEWQSAAAVRAHMLDRGHCKMAYDESEDPEELLKYYHFDFTEVNPMDIDKDHELALENGLKLGHRKFLKYYKRSHNRKIQGHPSEEEQQTAVDKPESLRRKERRHLTITDGKEQDIKRTANGIKEATVRNEFFKQLSVKQNNNQTLRARIQNPK